MQVLVLLLAALGPQQDVPHAVAATEAIDTCAVQRLRPFLSPYGIQQSWPVLERPPQELLLTLGTPISDMGQIADGYQHFLHVDAKARAVYVVEQGGFAGTTKVYGPLPLPRCAPTVEAPPH